MKKEIINFELRALQAAHMFFQERKRGADVTKELDKIKAKLEVIKKHYPNFLRLCLYMILLYILIILETLIASNTMKSISLNLSGESSFEKAKLFHYLLTFFYGLLMIVLTILTGKYLYFKKHNKLEAGLFILENPNIFNPRIETKLAKTGMYSLFYGIAALLMLILAPIAMHVYRIYIMNEGQMVDSLIAFIPLLFPIFLVVCLVYLSQFKIPFMLYFSTSRTHKNLCKKKEEFLENAKETVIACKTYSDNHTQNHGREPINNAQIKSCLEFWSADFSSDEFFSDAFPQWIEVTILHKYRPIPNILVRGYTADETSFQVQTNERGKAKLSWKSATPYLLSIKVNGVSLAGKKFPHEQNLTITLEELGIDLPQSLSKQTNGVYRSSPTPE